MTKQLSFLALMVSATLFFTSCEKDDPVIPNEEEVITTLKYTLTSEDGSTTVTLSFQDLDGDGGMEPVISEGNLSPNSTYNGRIELLNEAVTPIEDITEEVEEEDEDHQLFFQQDIPNFSITYNDEDENGKPVGLSTKVTTGESASGNIKITLVHKPQKSASGVADGEITNAEGEIDIEVSIPINVL